jgi:type 1 fimbria pilin
MTPKTVFIALALFAIFSARLSTAHAQGATFTYQGRLTEHGCQRAVKTSQGWADENQPL